MFPTWAREAPERPLYLSNAGGEVFYEYTRADGTHELRVTRTG